MTVVSYLDAALELAAIRDRISRYTFHGIDVPLPRGYVKSIWEPRDDEPELRSDPPVGTYAEYAGQQEEVLHEIVKSAFQGLASWRSIMGKKTSERGDGKESIDPDKISLFLTGSAAKFEFFPGSSDVDFLAVLHTNDPSSEQRDEWSNHFSELKKQLARATKANHVVPSNKRVTLSGAPYGATKTFLTPADIIGSAERDNEPNWAASFRAQLLTEARGIQCASDCARVVFKTQKHYCASLDLAEGLYPLLSTRLLLGFSISGVLAQAIELRKKSPSGTSSPDVRVIKAIISREWNSAINLLTLHIFYWRAVTEEGGRKQRAKRISRALSSAPLHQLCVDCPKELDYLTRFDVCEKLRTWLGKIGVRPEEIDRVAGSPTDVTGESRYRVHSGPVTEVRNGHTANIVEYKGGLLQGVKEQLSPGLPNETKPLKPLWISYLDAMDLYRKIRNGKSLGEDDIDQLIEWTKRFGAVLEKANDITRLIMGYDMTYQLRSGSTVLDGYKKLARCYAVSRLLS